MHKKRMLTEEEWKKRKCSLLSLKNTLEGELDYSDFVCIDELSDFVEDLVGEYKKRDPIIIAKMTDDKVFDTIPKNEEKQLNRICGRDKKLCKCYSFPCSKEIREAISASITVQFKVNNQAPSICPECKGNINSNSYAAITLFDIRVDGKLGRSLFWVKLYKCARCNKKYPTYQLPDDIQYYDNKNYNNENIESKRKSRFTVRLQDAVLRAFSDNMSPTRISQAYGFSKELAQKLSTKSSKKVKRYHNASEYHEVREKSLSKYTVLTSAGVATSYICSDKEYYSYPLTLAGAAYQAVFSIDAQKEICLTHIINQSDWDWLEKLAKGVIPIKSPKRFPDELNVLLSNYSRCKFPDIDHNLSYLILRLALKLSTAALREEQIDSLVIKEMKNCLSRLSALETTQSFYDSVMTIYRLSDSPLIKVEARRVIRYLTRMPVVFVNETISKSMRNEQTDRWSISTVKAIESAATKCEGSADYMIGRILYLNSAAIPIGYSYNNHEIHFPIDKGEFDFSRFSKQKYHGIPLYCINHLLNSGLLNDIDCSDIVCSTKKVQYGKEHPCQNKCPYVFYEE